MTARLRFGEADTSLGPMLVAVTDRGVAAMSRGGAAGFIAGLRRRFPAEEPEPSVVAVRPASEWLRGYLDGIRLDLPAVDLTGMGAWDIRTYEAIRSIPYGQTATYGEIALAIGSPGAARAVGGALSRCPLFPAVPCHRVVLAGDGFSGWGGGDIAVKRQLLELELELELERRNG